MLGLHSAIRSLNSPRFSQSGQVGMVILLMMAVILTVGLSVASRTSQDLQLSNQTSDSARVFNAAESVLDQAIAQLQESFVTGDLSSPTGTIEVNDTTVTYTITPTAVMESRILEGTSVSINLVDPVADPNGLTASGSSRDLRLDWSKTDYDADCTVTPLQPASLLVMIYSTDGTQTNVRTQTIAGCNRSDSFTPATTLGATAPYRFWTTIPLQAGDLFVRVKPLYTDTHLLVNGNGLTLPTQFYTITADARNLLGNETSKIQVNQTLNTAPTIMDYVVYSGSRINK